MTLQEINSIYSFTELQRTPGDGELRRKLFSPFLIDLYENKIVYYEGFLCVAILENLEITPEKFSATAIPYINIKKPGGGGAGLQKKPWNFGAAWPYMRLLEDHFGTYGLWIFWTDKELVKNIEELALKKDFKKARELTAYRE